MMGGVAPVRPIQPMVPGGVAMPGMVGTQPMMPLSSAAPVSAPAPVASIAPMVPPAMVPTAATQPLTTAAIPPQPSGVPGGVMGSVAPVPATGVLPPGTSAAPTPATITRTGSQDSGGSQTPGEWAVPQASKLKFTQVFNMSDRTKSGYLSGVQARNILIQSHLPQQALAQIWALSDVDNDGRLSCEEFVLAMYLCESAKAGNKLPTVLPADLIPPTNRRQRTASIQSGGSGGTPVADILALDNSFEDKRRENFEKGQAELERRRKALLDAQRRETEERMRREREEEAKREKARQEVERRRQEELEREMQRQQEVETQREQERKRQEDMKEQARKDAEQQRQQEWEKQRLQELMNVRQRQQENLLSLKAKNQSLSIDLTTKEDRVKELTQKISETRQGVTEVKATIDTMRTTRDTHMADMNQLKAQARDQNQRLLTLNQEKARLKARNTAAAGASGAEQAAVDALLTSKQLVIKQLQEKVDELQGELSGKEEDVNNNISDLTSLKDDMKATAERCAEVYVEFTRKRKEVLVLREKLLNPDAAWGEPATSTWAGKGFGRAGAGGWGSAWPSSPDTATTTITTTSTTTTTTTPPHAWPSSSDFDGSAQQHHHHATSSSQPQQPPARPPPPSHAPTASPPPVEKQTTSPPPHPPPPAQDTLEAFSTAGQGWRTNQLNHSTSPSSSSTTSPWAAFTTTTTTTTTTSTTTTNSHQSSTTSTTTTTTLPESGGEKAGEGKVLQRRRALYQFDARNHDEVSFMPGDIIEVTMLEGVEPGWMGGEVQGHSGWFPEAYTELIDDSEAVAGEEVVRSQLENIPEENVGVGVGVGEGVGEVAAGANQQNVLGEAVAVFPWRAKQRNHLSFNKADRIIVREQQDQWWYGELNNVGGWFPRSFVRMVSGPTASTSPATTPQDQPEEPPMPDNLVNDEVSQFYYALYPYQSGEVGDLSFNAGEVILVVKKEGDWWHGIINQTSGIFPSNYVELLPNQFITNTGNKVEEESVGGMAQEENQEAELEQELVASVDKGSKGKKPEIASVLAPYDATSSNQLSLQRGQLVMIRKKTASGWWEGELQAKGKKRQIGWFPATYVKVLGGSSRSTPVSMELTGRDDAPPDSVTTPTSAPSAPTSITQVTVTPPTDEPMKGPNDASNGFAEQVEALYPYTAMNEDELTFEAGAIISVIDKEDAAWWKGTLEGAIGVFPSNYVQPYSAGRDTPEEDDLCSESAVVKQEGGGVRTSWGEEQESAAMRGQSEWSRELRGGTAQSSGVRGQNEWSREVRGVTGQSRGMHGGMGDSSGVRGEGERGGRIHGEGERGIGVHGEGERGGGVRGEGERGGGVRGEGERSGGVRASWVVSASNPIEQQRQSVIQEFITTEATYLNELLMVEELFIKKMRASGIVNEKELDTLFVNWNELILANSYFNKALKIRCLNSRGGVIAMVADVLCQQISQLTPYLRFCSLQMRGATLLTEKCGTGGAWGELVRRCQEHPAIQGHTLTSFLLKPMQRITKYPLLIKQLLKYTPEGHPDYHNSQEALTAAETLCAQVNEALSQRDNTDKLEWMQRHVICEGLQERLVFNSLTNILGPRKLLHTGVLHKTKSKRELVAFLLSDILLLTTPSKSVAGCTSLAALDRALISTNCTMYRKPMFLTELRVEVDKESENYFTLVSPNYGEVAVASATTHERNNWLKKVAMAQKHINDTQNSHRHRQQSKERDVSIMGRVLVTVMAGVSLNDRQSEGALQSFCEVSLGSQLHRTATAASPHPKWDSSMQFLVKSLSEDVLCITVYEKGYFKPNEFLGRTEIKIHQVYEETLHQQGAQPQLHKLALQETRSGEVILKISLQLFDRYG
ncbi:hypothetical protein Pcinc_002655 [Petrolisthes cinctipes]|uniref:Intersectin-1-like n=1 Tax=Petrolisthes cinctipes TaxID=88211 RepID=A0AAE1L220_PETCI|nr:hypothetical protein Pcinc_002655 [Petrolisthes cinctipes]